MPPDTSAHHAAREVRSVLVNLLTLLAQGALPAFHVQLARSLGADGYGLYSWSSGFIDTFSVLTLLGMDVALAKHVSVAVAAGDLSGAARTAGSALRVVVLSGVIVAACVFIGAPWIAAWQGKPGLVAPLRLLVCVPIAYHMTTIMLVATQAKMVMRYDFWARGITQPLLLLVLSTIAMRIGFGVAGAAGAVALGMALVAGLASRFFAREFPLPTTLRSAALGRIDRTLVRDALPLVAVNIIGAAQGRIDTLVLGHYRPSSDVGAYGACMIYVVSLVQVRSVFYPVVAASLPPAIEKGDWLFVRALIQRQTRWIAILAMPLCVLFAGFGDGLLAIFGREFTAGRDALAWLAVGYLTSAHVLASYVLTFSGRVRYVALSAAACVALQAVLLPILIPRYGMTGAAMSAAAGLFVSNGLQLAFTYAITRVQPFSVGWFKVAVAAGAGFATGRWLFTSMSAGLAPRFFAGVGLALAVYIIALLSLGITGEERELLRRALKK